MDPTPGHQNVIQALMGRIQQIQQNPFPHLPVLNRMFTGHGQAPTSRPMPAPSFPAPSFQPSQPSQPYGGNMPMLGSIFGMGQARPPQTGGSMMGTFPNPWGPR